MVTARKALLGARTRLEHRPSRRQHGLAPGRRLGRPWRDRTIPGPCYDLHVGTPAADLAAWIPRLLATWRAARRTQRRGGPRPPPDALLPDELREVAAAVTRLSTGLTRERELAGARYLDDERLLGAYLLFYWPVSYLQARGVLSELPRRPRAVLDLGSGPGPLALARYLRDWVSTYSRKGQMHCHLNWHVALWQLELGQRQGAWETYRASLHPGASWGPPLHALADSASHALR